MNKVVRKVKMNACRKATKISSRLIPTLPRTAGIAIPKPMPALIEPALRIKPNGSKLWIFNY